MSAETVSGPSCVWRGGCRNTTACAIKGYCDAPPTMRRERMDHVNCIATGCKAASMAAEIVRLRAAMYQACSDMGCFCAEEGPEKSCPMCKLEKALHG